MPSDVFGSRREATIALSISLLFLVGMVSAQPSFGVADSDPATDTTFDFIFSGPNVTFIGNTLEIIGGSGNFELQNRAGAPTFSLFDSFDNNGTLNITQIGEGRYTVNDTSSASASSRVNIDVVRNNSDVTGRIRAPQGGPPQPEISGTPNISMFYWENATEIPRSAYETGIDNLTNMNPGSNNNERLYRLNATGLHKYWIMVNASGYGLSAKASRNASKPFPGALPAAPKPRINDFALDNSYFVSGQVFNNSNRSYGPDVKIQLTGYNGEYLSRTPLTVAPPRLVKFTDSNGAFNFTGLSPGNYKIEVMNNSRNDTYDAFNPTVEIDEQSPSSFPGFDFNITSHTGDVSGTLEGSRKSNVKYAAGVFNDTRGRTYIKNGIKPPGFTLSNIPNGSYEVMVAKFETGSGSPIVSIAGPKIAKVQKNNITNVSGEFEFPVKVDFNGTVVNSTGGVISDARVILENRSERKFTQTVTDSNGTFSTKVTNNTDYNIKIIPPFNSNYKITEDSATINANTGLRLDRNLTVSTGATLKGWVKEGSQGLEAEVFVWNGTKHSYGFAETDSSGYYEINGLEQVSYRVDVYIHKPGIDSNRTAVNISSDTEMLNFSSSVENATLSGNVTGADGSLISGNVTVTGPGANVWKYDTFNSSDFFNVTGLPKKTFYRIKILPDSSNYRTLEEQLVLFENTSIDFQLDSWKSVEGYVFNGSSSAAVGASGIRVFARNDSRDSFDSDTTDSNGFYNLTLKSHNHTFQIIPPENTDYEANKTRVNVAGLSGHKNFSLSDGKTLKGNITDNSTGAILGSGNISIWNSTEEIFRSTSYSSGEYSFSGLKDVGYNIWVDSDNESYQPNRTVVGSGELGVIKNLTLELNNGRSLRVTVKDDSTSETLANATVIVNGGQNETDSSGNALFHRQEEGDNVTITVIRDDYTSISKKVEIDKRTEVFGNKNNSQTLEYQNVSVTLTNPREVEVNFNVTDSNDELVSEALVIVRSNRTNVSHSGTGVTGTNGETSISGLVAGNSTDYGGGYLLGLKTDGDTVYRNETWMSEGSTGKILFGGKFTVMYEVP